MGRQSGDLAPHYPASAASHGKGTGGGTDNTRRGWKNLGMRLYWHLAKGTQSHGCHHQASPEHSQCGMMPLTSPAR